MHQSAHLLPDGLRHMLSGCLSHPLPGGLNHQLCGGLHQLFVDHVLSLEDTNGKGPTSQGSMLDNKEYGRMHRENVFFCHRHGTSQAESL